MTLSASIRKKNWPVYASRLDISYGSFPEIIAELKSYYFSENTSETKYINKLNFEKLLLAPVISDELISSVKESIEKKRQSTKLDIIREVLSTQTQMGAGFGNRSLFQHQEGRIIDGLGFFDIDWIEYLSRHNSSYPLKALESYLGVSENFGDYITSLSIRDNNQNWRNAQVWIASILSTPPQAKLKRKSVAAEKRILGATSVTYNLLNLKKKIESDEMLPSRGDDVLEDKDSIQEKNMWCIEPLEGKPQFFVNNMSSLIKYGKHKKIDKHYDSSDDALKYLPKIMVDAHDSMEKSCKLDEDRFKFKVGVDTF